MSALSPRPDDDFTTTLHRASIAAMLVWVAAAGKDPANFLAVLGLADWGQATPEQVAKLTAKARAAVAGSDCLAPFSVVAGGRA